jgi:hypothetical protein
MTVIIVILFFCWLGSSTTTKRQLLVRRSEMENCHATIVLACLADGNILPPAVILKVILQDSYCDMTHILSL